MSSPSGTLTYSKLLTVSFLYISCNISAVNKFYTTRSLKNTIRKKLLFCFALLPPFKLFFIPLILLIYVKTNCKEVYAIGYIRSEEVKVCRQASSTTCIINVHINRSISIKFSNNISYIYTFI